MTIENQNTAPLTFENRLNYIRCNALKLGKLMLLRTALRIVGDTAPDVPEQRSASEASQQPEGGGVGLVERCTEAFAVATKGQLGSADHTYIKWSNQNGVQSEYIAVQNGVFLHRPALGAEEQLKHPYWLTVESVASESETDLPTLYHRDFMIDALGNILAHEYLYDGQKVLRQLDDAEAQPLHKVLENPVVYRIVPITEPSTL